jgi:recombinational DNA repair ATPase RecF
MQSTHVLSECYRFISRLSDVVPRIHILLGNHDLAYRRDYQTTALDALNFKRLAPYVSLHSEVAHHEWDGRRVILLPFREEQNELTEAVAALSPNEACKIVAFAHLAINKAITQRYVARAGVDNRRVANSIVHRGLTGPDWFASLARTFTGHFHSHQTITQDRFCGTGTNLQGSVTYLGSPLQLSWADLYDEQRGVVLFDPETLEHKLLTNPHAIGYVATDLQQVLDDEVNINTIVDKHVMLIGNLTHLKYVTARDKLLSLGARSVRNWTPAGLFSKSLQPSSSGLGSSVPASDIAIQVCKEPTKNERCLATITNGPLTSDATAHPRVERLDLKAEVHEYVDSVDLDQSLLLRREELVRIGQRIIQVSHETIDHDEVTADYKEFIHTVSQVDGTRTATELVGSSTYVFVAIPRTLTITNFLGIQNTIVIDFRQDIPRGLTFLIGENGSGKSTLIEAMTWCQFGRCIRGGLAANDVVNDSIGKNCFVKLDFANGYSITRYRKHKVHKNRVVVSLHGKPQSQLEHPDARTTQAAIDELLGTDYETYIRTVVLSHSSAASFLNSTPVKRRELIEASLGLSILDRCGQTSRVLFKSIDMDINKLEGKLEEINRTKEYNERRLDDLKRTQKRLQEEAEEAVACLKTRIHDQASKRDRNLDLDMEYHSDISAIQDLIQTEQERLQRLRSAYMLMHEKKPLVQTSWLGRLQQQISQRLQIVTEAQPKGLSKLLQTMKSSILSFSLITVRGVLSMLKIPRDGYQKIDRTQSHNEEFINSLTQEINTTTSQLLSLEKEEELAINHADRSSEQSAQAIRDQTECEALQQQVTIKQSDAATYRHIVETEHSSLNSLRLEHDKLFTKLQELAADRELFVFWSSALSKRTRRALSSSPSSTKRPTANFRKYVLERSMSELNGLLIQVLTVLYDDTCHAPIATGMLCSLFDTESDNITSNSCSSGSVLDQTLAVHPSLAYSKRSSGERKRIDLALLFALLQLVQARSAHRAHYMLVDEVFDNLDSAGQEAVTRWCGVMLQTAVGWVVVITHSQYLVDRDPGGDTCKALVVTARMGQRGTELFVNDRKVCGG